MFNRFRKIFLIVSSFIVGFFVFSIVVYAAEYTGFGVQFDVNPKLIKQGVTTPLDVTFKGNVANLVSLNEYCSGKDLVASVFSPLENGQTAGFRDNISPSPVKISSLKPGQQISWDFRKNYTHSTAVNYRLFQGVVTCGGKEVAVSSPPIQINISGTGPGGGNAGGNGGGGTPGTGTGGKPGSTQTYGFEIPNPLKGGADDFSELVKIIAQWIFNLAIPIAVSMIVYSGILFLTAAGEPAKVTKAKDVLKWAVVGLAIIMIGSGFVTLIQSILELGGTETTQDQGSGLPVTP